MTVSTAIFAAIVGGLVSLYVLVDWLGKRMERRYAQRDAERSAAYQAWCERVGEPAATGSVSLTVQNLTVDSPEG